MDIDRELQFGPGMRVQRLVEAGFLVVALFTQDERFAYVTLALNVLQVLSPRCEPVALVVARFLPFRGEHRIGDLYFDQGGVRGASAISMLVQALGLGLLAMGYRIPGFLVLTMPAASLLMMPTAGFCAGCWFYVLGRDWLARRGSLKGVSDDHHDISIDGEASRDQPQLRSAAQR